MPTAETIRVATDYLNLHARAALTEAQAKLYSQSVRRQMGREGLATFGSPDIQRAMDEAFLLIQYALLTRGAVSETSWQDGVKRAAEILEWLSQADLRPNGAPLHLLSAAAYQVAGYPAMALGELKRLTLAQSIPSPNQYWAKCRSNPHGGTAGDFASQQQIQAALKYTF
jgi:hypothetical protein